MTFTRGASDPDSDSDSDSSYTSSEEAEEEVERNEKKVHRSLPSPNKIPVVSSAPKHPPPSSVSKDDERVDEEDSEDDGFSDEEFDEGETAELEMNRQPHNLSDHDSSDETPPSPPNSLPPVPSKDDRDKDDNKNVDSEEDESSGESDDGETTGNLQSHNPSPTSSTRVDASPETIMHNSPSPLPARGSCKRKHVADSSENNQNRKHASSEISWSLDDEIALLKGLVEYHSENGIVPSADIDMDGVRHLIKNSIRLEVSDKQLADKKEAHCNVGSKEKNNCSQKCISFKILWSLEDEIALLNGLVEYHSENDTVPSSANDVDEVCHLIKSSLRLEVSNKLLAVMMHHLQSDLRQLGEL